MDITWDPHKAIINFQKHSVRFSDAESVLFDPMALTRDDDDAKEEQRFLSVGMNAVNEILVVVYTYRGDGIRLISARRATPKERRIYEKGI